MVTSLVQVTGEVHGVIAEPTDFDLFYRSEYDRLVRVALVGYTNVGKSTLYNRLTDTRDALVSDLLIPATPSLGVAVIRE